MPVLFQKHEQSSHGYLLMASILGALTLFGWILLKSCAIVLANWQTGHW